MIEHTKIKFCGMTRSEDVQAACALGVDVLGFIFYPKSKRAIDIDTAIRISENVPNAIERYAVVVNPSENWLKQMLVAFQPTAIQFHGDESPEFCQKFGYPYIKSVAATTTQAIIDAANQYKDAIALLIDTPAGTDYGGTGQTFDWTILPGKINKQYILAGGLNVDNVVDAVKLTQPMMVDCCSGIESQPGLKSAVLMKEFILRIRGE